MIVLMRVLGRTRDKSELIVEPLAEVEDVSTEEAVAALETMRAAAEDRKSTEVGDEN